LDGATQEEEEVGAARLSHLKRIDLYQEFY